MSNYICRPLTAVPDIYVKQIKVATGDTLHAGQVVCINSLDSGITNNYTVFAGNKPATSNLGLPMAIIINDGFEKLSDGRRPSGQPDYTQYTFGAGEICTAIQLATGMEFEISNDSVDLNSVTPAAGTVLYPVDSSYSLKLDTALNGVPSGTFSSFTVLNTKYFRLGGNFGGQFASTMIVSVNKPTPNKAVTQAASTASAIADLVTDFNALLTKLKNAGLMA